MVNSAQCKKAAQDYLEQLHKMLQNLPPQYSTQAELARAAGVSDPTISDYKNLKKLKDPQFREVFQISYALLGHPPFSLKDSFDLKLRRFKLAQDRDRLGILDKIVSLLISDLNLADLSDAIDIWYKKIGVAPQEAGEGA